jgi:sugar lactone lactonase YvrE
VGPDGATYVSQLTGFPFPVGGASVFRIDPRTGAVTTYATGFTMAMDLAFGRDGTLYVLEIDSNSLLQDGTDGGIWAVPRRGGTPSRIDLPAGTLTEPGGIAVGRNGDLYVSNHAREAGNGQVLRIDLD